MAARFQRLESDSSDIGASPPFTQSPRFYDQPQDAYSTDEPQYTPYSDQRRMTNTKRKPVANTIPLQHPSHPQSYSATPEQSLITNYFDASYAESKPTETPFSDSERKSRASVVTKTISRVWSKARGPHVSQVSTPLWAAPWRHDQSSDMGGRNTNTVRRFNSKRQQNRIFFHFFIQWLVPVIFCAAIAGTLRFYSSKDQVTQRQKYMFNALVLGFGLCLGFAVVAGMKEYVDILRWRLLAGRYRSLQQFELLMGISSQTSALRFLWAGRTEGSILPNGTQILCLCYLLIMMGLQIAIALLGLCYSVDGAPGKYFLERGNVSIASLGYIQQADDVYVSDADPYLIQSGAVNSYGISGQRYGVVYTADANNSSQPSNSNGLPLFTDNATEWWYWFLDRNADPESTVTYYTNRFLYANASCTELTVERGGFVDDDSVTFLDPQGDLLYLAYTGSETAGTTTYYGYMDASCGSRCTTLYVLNVGLSNPLYKPQLFQCNNTVSHVGNSANLTDSGAYQLPNEQARLVAGAIGYSGADYTDRDLAYQSHTYDVSSLWSWTRMNGVSWTETDVANLIMRFSMSAIASMDNEGPRSFVIGDTPISAQQVNVLWLPAIIFLCIIPGTQFLILILTVVWGNKAVVRDGSFLSAASLLRPIAEKLERSGCALTSDEICEVLGNPNVAYGVRVPEGESAYGGMAKGSDETKHLDVLFEDENTRVNEFGWRVGMHMQDGSYDGVKKIV